MFNVIYAQKLLKIEVRKDAGRDETLSRTTICKLDNLRSIGHINTDLRLLPIPIWGCSSAGRAPALQAGGQEFDPPHLHHSGNEKDYTTKLMGL